MFNLLEDDELYAVENPGYFITPFALMPDRMPELVGKHGSLLAVPSPEVMLVYPINDSRLLDSMGAFIMFTNAVFAQVPDPISPAIYWYNDSRYMNLPYTYGMSGLEFGPPEEFHNLLVSLEEQSDL
ncbi:MAG: hypothetical protein NUW23_13055 [Firmicutes bacterium]|jgi:hypothetical protein|nr:hypothetical protein [Bacillota bacterium]